MDHDVGAAQVILDRSATANTAVLLQPGGHAKAWWSCYSLLLYTSGWWAWPSTDLTGSHKRCYSLVVMLQPLMHPR